MIFRLSQNLATKIHAGRLATKALDENPYADWSAHLFTANRTQYILVSNTKSLYSCVMFGKGITDKGEFIKRVLGTIRDAVREWQPQVYEHLVPSASRATFAKPLNGANAASIADMIKVARRILAQKDISPYDLGRRLNARPFARPLEAESLARLLCTLPGKASCCYGTPKQAFLLMYFDRFTGNSSQLQTDAHKRRSSTSESGLISIPKSASSANYRFNIEEWLPLFSLAANKAKFKAQIVTGPSQVCNNELLRREMQDRYNWGPAVPVDIFIMAKGEPEERSVTKIAGLPYRPASAPWPKGRDGEPMQFVAQFSFGDSKDLTGELPGDMLLVFSEKNFLDGMYHFEWQRPDVTDLIQAEAIPKQPYHLAPCFGCIYRTLSYPKAVPAISEAPQERRKCRGHDVFADRLLLQWQATQIGTAPYLVQDIPKRWLPGKILCTLSSVHPDQHAKYPWVNHPKPLMRKGQWAHVRNHLMLGDVGCLYISLDKKGELHGLVACY